jgi:simple sugar transport system ATP-binding protein
MVLRRGENIATFARNERSIGEVIELMAGGAELQSLLSSKETALFEPADTIQRESS